MIEATLRTAILLAALPWLLACGGGPATTAYTPPATRASADGAEAYVDAPLVDRAAAASLDPALGTPEAAVVKFLASRARGDDRWREAMARDTEPAAERALAQWADWHVQRFQLRGRKAAGEGRMWVRAWFEIVVDGDTDDGEDEFEVALGDGVWRIVRPPT
jgi:hypothetical protein